MVREPGPRFQQESLAPAPLGHYSYPYHPRHRTGPFLSSLEGAVERSAEVSLVREGKGLLRWLGGFLSIAARGQSPEDWGLCPVSAQWRWPRQVRPMSLDSVRQRALINLSGRSSVAVLATVFLVLTGCADHSVDLGEAPEAYLSMGVSFSEGASSQLGLVDAWRVQVIRPGEGVIAEDAGAVSPNQQSVTVEISVTLQASCELLTILIELSSSGEVWFRSEGPAEICVGNSNGIQAQDLQWVVPVIALGPTGLSFAFEEGGNSQTQVLTVSNEGGGTLNWDASADESWLGHSPTSGSLGPGQSATINVTVSDPDLTRGQYQGVITVADPNAVDSPRTASVSLTYVEKPRIGLSAASLAFTTDEAVNPEPQTLTITNLGEGNLNWGAVDDEEWLSLSPSTGSLGPGQSQALVVSASPGALPGGAYEATLTISDPNSSNSPQSVAVGLTVVQRPRIGLDPGSLSFTTLENEDPESQTLVISNPGGQTLNWTATLSDVGWLELSTASGALASGQSQSVTVLASSGERNPGVYEATITVADPWAMNSPQIVPVTFTIKQGPLIGLSVSVLNFSVREGASPLPRDLVVSNAGGGLLEWQATDDAPWMQLSPTSGVLGTIEGIGLAQNLTVGINASDLDPATYRGTITVSDPDAENSPQTVGVTLIVQPRVPPVISTLAVNLVRFEDPTCPLYEVRASRFEITFSYSDHEGDLPISDGSFVGTPVRTRWATQFGTNKTVNTTASVEGNGFSGQAGYQLCLSDQYSGTLDVWVTLRDARDLVSNQLHMTVPPWGGASSPAQDTVPLAPPQVLESGSVLVQKGAGR
jgi:hypothetical protein